MVLIHRAQHLISTDEIFGKRSVAACGLSHRAEERLVVQTCQQLWRLGTVPATG
jgi:hypothetical protein